MKVQTIYLLQKIHDNPLFEGFGSSEVPSFLGRNKLGDDFHPAIPGQWDWTVERLAPVWKTPTLAGRVYSFNDFPCLNGTTPAFSLRAVQALRDFLEPNGELLPLGNGDFYAYNCTTIVEILNRDECDALWVGQTRPQCASFIKYYSIFPERIQNLTIFRMRELSRVYVTNIFVDRIKQHGLNGFNCVKVWPFPKGVRYDMVEAERRRAEKQTVQSGDTLKEVKAQSIVIAFQLADRRISAAERRTIERFEDELDAQLRVRNLNDEYFGSLEGKKTRNGETRLFLSCPDNAALFAKLRPWLKSLPWHPLPNVYVRDARYDDFKCDEKQVSFC